METKIIEYQNQLDGKVHVYLENMIWAVGAMTPILGEQLIQQMTERALTFTPGVTLEENVKEISKNEEGIFILRTESGHIHLSKKDSRIKRLLFQEVVTRRLIRQMSWHQF